MLTSLLRRSFVAYSPLARNILAGSVAERPTDKRRSSIPRFSPGEAATPGCLTPLLQPPLSLRAHESVAGHSGGV
jgi:hypothetical protein